MPPLKRASLEPGPLSDLMDALHELHLAAGYPSTRDLQRDIGGRNGPSHAAIHKMLSGSKLPSWRLAGPLVRAMAVRAGRDEETEFDRFRHLWTRAARPGDAAAGPETTISARAEQSKPEIEAEPDSLTQSIADLMPSLLDELEAVGARDTTGSFRVPTGFDDLDALLGGWSQGHLIVVGGRPSSGKTTLLLNFCRAASVNYRLPTMIISGEMNDREIQSRLVSAEAHVPLHAMRTGSMDDENWIRVAQTISAMADAPLHIGTSPEFQIEQLITEATSHIRKWGLKLLLIDSLEWIARNDVPAPVSVEFALWRLKTLAETLKIPVIVTAHAERRPEGPRSASPITRLAHSDAIEQVADVVIILDRPDHDDQESMRLGEADLIVVKNRNGPTATVTLANQFHYSRFVTMWRGDYPTFPAKPPEV